MKHTGYEEGIIKLFATLFVALIFAFTSPLLYIYAINGIFNAGIEYSLGNYFLVMLLNFLLKAKISFNNK